MPPTKSALSSSQIGMPSILLSMRSATDESGRGSRSFANTHTQALLSNILRTLMGSAMTGWCPLLRSGVYVDDVSQKFLTYNVHFFVWNAHIEILMTSTLLRRTSALLALQSPILLPTKCLLSGTSNTYDTTIYQWRDGTRVFWMRIWMYTRTSFSTLADEDAWTSEV